MSTVFGTTQTALAKHLIYKLPERDQHSIISDADAVLAYDDDDVFAFAANDTAARNDIYRQLTPHLNRIAEMYVNPLQKRLPGTLTVGIGIRKLYAVDGGLQFDQFEVLSDTNIIDTLNSQSYDKLKKSDFSKVTIPRDEHVFISDMHIDGDASTYSGAHNDIRLLGAFWKNAPTAKLGIIHNGPGTVAGDLVDGAVAVPESASVRSVEAFGGNKDVYSERGQIIPVHFRPHRMMSPAQMLDTLQKEKVDARYIIFAHVRVKDNVFGLTSGNTVSWQLKY